MKWLLSLLPPTQLWFFPRYFPRGPGVEVVYDWPTPDSEGPIMRPMTKLATLIASCPRFRTRCGLESDDADAAEKLIEGRLGSPQRIFYPEVDWDHHQVFPSAVIQFGPAWRCSLVAGGARNYTSPSGSLRLILMDEDQYPKDIMASTRDIGTWIGQFFDDLRSQFGYDDELAADGISQESPIMFAPDEMVSSRGRGFWTASFLIEWSG